MKLSLHILADWLKRYEPELKVHTISRNLQNVRPLTGESPINPTCVYIGTSDDHAGKTLCIHQNDLLILNTTDAAQVLSEVLDAFEFYNRWSEQLLLELPYIGIQDLINRCTGIIRTLLMVSDASHYLLAYASTDRQPFDDPELQKILQNNILGMPNIMLVEKDPRIRKRLPFSYLSVQQRSPHGYYTYVRNLFTSNRQWGWLISVGKNHTQGELDLQDAIGEMLEQWLQLHQDRAKKWEHSGVFLELLEQNYVSKDNIRLRLQSFDWPAEEVKMLYLIPHPDSTGLPDMVLLRQIEQLSENICCFFYKGNLLAILCGSKLEQERFQRLLKEFLGKIGCRCGISPAFTDLFSLPDQHALALAAVSFSDSNQSELLCPFDQVILPYALSQLSSNTSAWLIHPAVMTLVEYDKSHETAFAQTLFIYLKTERSLLQTANCLGLHRNTLLYRIQRIHDLTNLDLDCYETRLHLLLSFEIISVHPTNPTQA